ncbi:MAG: Gx transporter family protein [Coriobacteriia bacterium]|nr:Gx transporter family protein [Coriobacteriia bacterium]
MSSTHAFADELRGAQPGLRSATLRVAYASALLATAVVLGLVESSLPPVALLPWLRIGLANIAVVVALLLCGARVAALVSGGRVVVIGLLTGTIASPVFAMAATGAALSLGVMVVLQRSLPSLSPVGLSAAGSVGHMFGQFLVAALVLGSSSVFVLAPPSVLVALAVGAATGLVAGSVVSRITKR